MPREETGGTYRFLKSYRVFHVSQIEGLDAAWHPKPEGDPAEGPTLVARQSG